MNISKNEICITDSVRRSLECIYIRIQCFRILVIVSCEFSVILFLKIPNKETEGFSCKFKDSAFPANKSEEIRFNAKNLFAHREDRRSGTAERKLSGTVSLDRST